MIMYAAAMGNAITAVFQCLSAISVKGFFMLPAGIACHIIYFNPLLEQKPLDE